MSERFSERERCAKCGHKAVSVTWRAALDAVADYLLVTCLRCGYAWQRAPLDTAETSTSRQPVAHETVVTLLGLPRKVSGVLVRNGIRTLGDLISTTEYDLSRLAGCGDGSRMQIKYMLHSMNMRLREDGEPSGDPEVLYQRFGQPEQQFSNPVGELDLCIRAKYLLEAEGILTIGDLCSRAERDLLQKRHSSTTVLRDIMTKLSLRGLRLGMNTVHA